MLTTVYYKGIIYDQTIILMLLFGFYASGSYFASSYLTQMEITYTIKEATSADISLITDLAAATWEPTYKAILPKDQIDYMFGVIYSEDALQDQIQEGQTFLLLYKEEIPVGFAAYSLKKADQHTFKLNKIYLLPECQGKGAGKQLLQRVEEAVKREGGAILDLNVNRHNQAKAFYEHCGYKVLLEEDIPIGPYWMNDYVMRKIL